MKSCFILSLVLSFTFTVFNVSGKYLLVEVDAEVETIPMTTIEGKNIGSESFEHYIYFHQVRYPLLEIDEFMLPLLSLHL